MRVRVLDIHPESYLRTRRDEVIGRVITASSLREDEFEPAWQYAEDVPGYDLISGRFEVLPDDPSPQREPRPGDRVRITEVSRLSCYYDEPGIVGMELTVREARLPDNDTEMEPGMYILNIPRNEDQLLNPPGQTIYGCRFEILTPDSQSVPLTPEKEPVMLDRGLLMLPDGNTYRATFTRLNQNTVDETLKKVAGGGFQKIAGAFTYDGNPVTICQNASLVVAGVDIKSLNINARCRMIGDAMVPVFVSNGDGVQLNCKWTPPEGCLLRVAISTKLDGLVRTIKDVFLFARSASSTPGGFFRLPLPNTFADGRMCMGNTFQFTVPSGTVEGLLAHAINHLNVSPWGTDMMPEESRLRAMFRFDPSTLNNLPITGTWHELCQRCSRVELDAQFS